VPPLNQHASHVPADETGSPRNEDGFHASCNLTNVASASSGKYSR
jgi:hypothetical protein